MIDFVTDKWNPYWFDPDSVENSLKSLLRGSDPDSIVGHNADDLAKELYHEIRFLGAYTAEELTKVFEYIHGHKEELHQYILDYFQNKNKSA